MLYVEFFVFLFCWRVFIGERVINDEVLRELFGDGFLEFCGEIFGVSIVDLCKFLVFNLLLFAELVDVVVCIVLEIKLFWNGFVWLK